MAKEDIKAPVEAPKADAPVVHAEGTVDIGAVPGQWDIAHKKKDGSDVIITVITN